MTQEERRKEILNRLRIEKEPIAGGVLAESYGVSRQIIVKDIEALREAGYEILSMHRGYVMQMPYAAEKVFCVEHDEGQMEDELYTIVDNGGAILDVFVEHEVYGRLSADLHVSSRRRVQEFLQEIKAGRSKPLSNITSGIHYHTVQAESDEILEQIEQELRAKGYLL